MRISPLLVFAIACGSAARPAPQPSIAAAPSAGGAAQPTGIPVGYVAMRAARVVALGDSAAVLLVDEGMKVALPIFIGGSEGASIDYRMRGDKPPRPLTHDLLDAIVRALGASIVKVQVDALRDGVFHGSVFLRASGRVIRVDSRASDAIALAIGNHIPIYVAAKVIEEAGIDPNSLQRGTVPPTTTS